MSPECLRINGRKVQTTHVFPPIPLRNFDWRASFADGDEGDPVGWGVTEKDALQDLYEQSTTPENT